MRGARFISLAGVTHFVLDDLPAGLHGLAYSHEGARQLSRGCVGDGLACLDPLGYVAVVTSGCVKSGRSAMASRWMQISNC